MRWFNQKTLILFIVPALLYVALLPVMPLMEPDEGRYSDIPSLMNRTGDYVTPRLNHVVYFEKPPLVYWATAVFFKCFGENDFSSRLFVGLCAWGLILLTFQIGRVLRDEKTGLYSAAVLGTSIFSFIMGRLNILDVPLAFFVCLATWAGYRFLTDRQDRRGYLYVLYASSSFAFLTKGLIGFVFPFAILAIWCLIERSWREVLRLVSPIGFCLMTILSAPWIILVQRVNPDFFRFFFIQEHFLRYSTTMHGRDQSVLFYIPVIFAGALPWLAFLWMSVKEKSSSYAPLFGKAEKRFLLVWFFFIFIFFSISSSKLIPYMSPVFPPIALFMGCLFRLYDDVSVTPDMSTANRLLYRSPVFIQSFLLILVLLAPPFLKSMRPGQDLVIMTSGAWPSLIALPILSLVAMTFVPDQVRRRFGKGWFLSVYLLTAVFLASLVFPISDFLTPYKSAYPVSQAIRKYLPEGEMLYQYRISLYGIDFYNHLRAPVVDDFGELGFGIQKLPPSEKARYFLRSEDFYRLCKEKGDIYAVTQYKERLDELRKNVPVVETLWDNGAFYLVRIRS